MAVIDVDVDGLAESGVSAIEEYLRALLFEHIASSITSMEFVEPAEPKWPADAQDENSPKAVGPVETAEPGGPAGPLEPGCPVESSEFGGAVASSEVIGPIDLRGAVEPAGLVESSEVGRPIDLLSVGAVDSDGTRGADLTGAAAAMGPAGVVDPVDLIGQVQRMLDQLDAVDWHGLPGERVHEAMAGMEQAGRRLAAASSRALVVAEGNGLWALQGYRSVRSWLRAHLGTTGAAAGRDVRRARALRDHLPRAAEALAEGLLGSEHVGVLEREATRSTRLREQLLDPELGEEFLVDQAGLMDAGQFNTLVRTWAVASDPEGADRAWREADAKEELSISQTLGGYHVAGWLDEASGQIVSTALTAHMGDRVAGDERTPAQRRASALVGLCHQTLDSGELRPYSRVRPHVTVTATLETLRTLAAASGSVVPPEHHGRRVRTGGLGGPTALGTLFGPGGPRSAGESLDGSAGDSAGDPPGNSAGDSVGDSAGDFPESAVPQEGLEAADPFVLSDEARRWMGGWVSGDDHQISTAIDHKAMIGVEPARFEDGTPISPALLARLVCESQLGRVIFGADSTVLDVGREMRIYPAHMVRAIHARDKHCQYPGCHEPPGYGEIHHSLQWYRDNGPTDVEHGILLCWHHHDLVHSTSVTITRTAGRWHFYDRNGHPVTGGPPTLTAQPPPEPPEPEQPPEPPTQLE